ncbi:MAG: PfkB family carbohydrate kinase [Pirellulaceae bacterium]|nr:PfkB family carbohydrate kinase [Pirellulaceae bacterium]
MTQRNTIVGIGETLFDVVGNQSSLGGAPLNFCVMVNQLLQPLGFTTAVVSAIGNDARGTTARRHLDNAAIDTTHLQTHPTLATGVARIHENVDPADDCSFEILPDVAWDDLRWTAMLDEFTQQVCCVVYGTLAQRSAQSRQTIHKFLAACTEAIRLFDVNLRLPNYDAESIRTGCATATVLKLNSHELYIVADAANIQHDEDPVDTGRRLLEHFSLNAVVLTASDKGTTIITADQTYVGNVPQVVVQSSVGAGDACTAGIVAGLTLNLDFASIVGLANEMGALVAANDAPNIDIPRELIGPYISNV